MNGNSRDHHEIMVPRAQRNASHPDSGKSGQTKRFPPNSRIPGSVNENDRRHYDARPTGVGDMSSQYSENPRQTGFYTQNGRDQGSFNRGHYGTRPTRVGNNTHLCGRASENFGQTSYVTRNGGSHHETRPAGVGNISSRVSENSGSNTRLTEGVSGRGVANSDHHRSHYQTASENTSGNASGLSSNFITGGRCRQPTNVIALGDGSAQNNHHAMTGRYGISASRYADSGTPGHGGQGMCSTARNSKTREQLGEQNDSLNVGSHVRREGEHNVQRPAKVTRNSHESNKAGREGPTVRFHPDSSTEGSARIGSAGTHRSRENVTQASPESPGSNTHNTDGHSGPSGKGYAWQARSTDKATPARNLDMKQKSYGEKLARTLSKKIEHIAPERPREKGRPKSSVPSTREEAKRDLKTRMKVMKTKLDSQEKENSSQSGSGSGIGSGKSGTDGKPGVSSGRGTQDEGDHDTTTDDKPSQKPFGARGNIHTLGCFQGHGNKRVTTVCGKVHGFAPS